MNRKAQRAALIKEAQEIISKAGDSATDEQLARLDEINTEVKSLTEAIDRAEKGDQLIAAINSLGETHDEAGERPAKSLGEHFVKGLQDGQLAALKAQFDLMVNSAETLLTCGESPELMAEIRPWVQVMQLMGQRGQILTQLYTDLHEENPEAFIAAIGE